ncbi:hypothetical protein ACOMHN_026733 [Nucella lapillus]
MPDHESWIMLPVLLLALFSPARAQISLCGDALIPQLVFTPSTLILNRNNPEQRVRITCRYPSLSAPKPKPLSLALNRTLHTLINSTGLAMANINGVKNLGNIYKTSLNGTYETAINFTLPSASCADTNYVYTCESVSTLRTTPANRVSCLQVGGLSAKSEPSDVMLEANPSADSHGVGDVLTLTCSATAGLIKEVSRAEWVWQSKKGNGIWTRVTDNIYLNTLMTKKGCLMVRSSVFKVTLLSGYNDMTYRCYMIKNGQVYIEAARSYCIKVDSFIFGLKTIHGAVVLGGILIIVLAVIAAVWVGVRHFMRYQVNKERNMYRERVMNRLDKLFRFEAELIGGVMKKRQSQQIDAPPPEPAAPPELKKRLREESADPTEITIELQMSQNSNSEEPSEEPDTSDVESETESEEESDIFDPTGPIDKV